ncbi:MAG TPA: HAD family hydrolase [Paucimonas sp.]|nr:HAD family hydrolase [Paucimonas sp.]
MLFDLDDTLWPIVPVIRRAEAVLYDWLREHAVGVARLHTIDSLRARRLELAAADPRYRYDMWALRHAGLLEAFAAAGEDTGKVLDAMAVFSAARNQVEPFADVQPALHRLAARLKLGSVTNGVADLEVIGLARHFHVSISARKLGCAKPDAAIFHAACEALGVQPAEAAYVGDDPVLDVEGAQKAGLHGIWINRAEIDPVRTCPPHIRPDAICRTLHDLDAWLAESAANAEDD